jgi:hypothetical protein
MCSIFFSFLVLCTNGRAPVTNSLWFLFCAQGAVTRKHENMLHFVGDFVLLPFLATPVTLSYAKKLLAIN